MNPPYKRAALSLVMALGLLGVVPGVAFAAQPSCGDTITANTMLTADLDCSGYAGNALTFGANGIVLDLNGHTVTGFAGADSYYGVYTDSYNNVVVKNGTIEDFDIGLYSHHTSNSRYRNLTIVGEVADTDDYGVYNYYGAGNVYKNLDISGVDYGIYSYYSASTQFRGSMIEGESYGYYGDADSRNFLYNNTFHATSGDGVYDDQGGWNRYERNRSNSNSGYGFYIYCYGYGKTFLINNVANHNGDDGFYLEDCYDDVSYANGSLITGNTANWNGDDGFEDYYSTSATWTYNTAKNNGGDGFYFDYPGNATIKWNYARGNDESGFYFDDSYQTGYYNAKALSYNTSVYNDDYGFYADYPMPGKGNVAHHNPDGNCYQVVC